MAKKTPDESSVSALGRSEDEDLSALLDGELSPERAEQLRRRLANEPGLAARCAELGEVSGQLQNLAQPADRSESEVQLEGARVQGMHAALRRRIAAEETEAAADSSAGTSVEDLAPVIPLRVARPWLAPAIAAVAAGLTLYLVLGNFRSDDSSPGGNLAVLDSPEPVILDLENTWAPPGPAEVAQTEGGADGVQALAQMTQPKRTPDSIAEIEPEAYSEAPGETVAERDDRLAVDLGAVGDEELAIAFEFDVLADFDVIENLELLELLDELDTLERI